jgi:hypothetical protein
MEVIEPGCPISALLLTPSTRSSVMLSADGHASESGLLLPAFCVVIPSTEVSDMNSNPPCTEYFPSLSG